MRRRYDYHSLYEQVKGVSLLFPIFMLLFLWFFFRKSHPFGEVLLVAALVITLITLLSTAVMQLKHTYIEIDEQGILFKGWKREVFSTWAGVRKIKSVVHAYKIYTDNGNFYIRRVEPANMPTQTGLDLMRTDRAEFLNELIEEIKKRAPHVEMTYSVFTRPL